MATFTVEYSSNNSGGDWWLDDGDWKALESAGWAVKWAAGDEFYKDSVDKEGRWLGALAKCAHLTVEADDEYEAEMIAVRRFEKITGQNADERGCPCCGPPHWFWTEPAEKEES